MSKAKTKKTRKRKKKTSLTQPVARKRRHLIAHKVVDVTNNEIIEKAYGNGVQIIVENPTDFMKCVRLLQGSNAVIFRTTHQYGLMRERQNSTVYFFPYQGYLILYAEPQG